MADRRRAGGLSSGVRIRWTRRCDAVAGRLAQQSDPVRSALQRRIASFGPRRRRSNRPRYPLQAECRVGLASSSSSVRNPRVPALRSISSCGSPAEYGSSLRSILASRTRARRGGPVQPAIGRGRGGAIVSNPKILVLGAGGTGGYFGGRLVESGADVTFLVREGRRKILSEQGLRIESPFGAARLGVETVVAPDLAPSYDAAMLTCKACDLDTAVAAIASAVAPTGYVLPFLNGIAHIDVLNQRFGQHRVLGGTAKIQSTLTSNGAIRQFNDWRTLTFGEQSGEMTERVRTLAALFAAAKGVEAFAVTDIVQRMWEKLVHLSTAAAMTCLMRANVGEIVRTPNGRELFLDQLRCGAAIAAANGHAPSEGFMRSWEETFSQRDSQYATSMLRDVERGGPTEVEHILGFMLNKASEANIAHRTLLLAYTHIKLSSSGV